MGQHRTKEQKMKAQIRREQMVYSLPKTSTTAKSSSKISLTQKQKQSDDLGIGALQTFALKDIIHSGIATTVIIVILTVTYFYLR